MAVFLVRLAFVISLKNSLQVLSAECIIDHVPSGPCAWHNTTACMDKQFFNNSLRNHTLLGAPCKRWDTVYVNTLVYNFGSDKNRVGNTCQNPSSHSAPWCFSSASGKEEDCYPDCKYKVPPCIDQVASCARYGSASCNSSSFLQSSRRKTRMGRICLRWDSADVTNIYGSINFGSNGNRVENTCQNPDGTRNAPWCFYKTSVVPVYWGYCYRKCPDPPTTTTAPTTSSKDPESTTSGQPQPIKDPTSTKKDCSTSTSKNIFSSTATRNPNTIAPATHKTLTTQVKTDSDGAKDSQSSCVSPLAVGLIVGAIIIVFAVLLVIALILWKRQNNQMKQQSPTTNRTTIPSTQQQKASADYSDVKSAATATETTHIQTARTETTKPPERNLLAPAKMPPEPRTERLSTMQEPTENYAPRN